MINPDNLTPEQRLEFQLAMISAIWSSSLRKFANSANQAASALRDFHQALWLSSQAPQDTDDKKDGNAE